MGLKMNHSASREKNVGYSSKFSDNIEMRSHGVFDRGVAGQKR